MLVCIIIQNQPNQCTANRHQQKKRERERERDKKYGANRIFKAETGSLKNLLYFQNAEKLDLMKKAIAAHTKYSQEVTDHSDF